MKVILSILIGFFATPLIAYGDSIKFQTPAFNKVIHTKGVLIERIQPKLRCHLKNNKTGHNQVTRKYVFSQIEHLGHEDDPILSYQFVSKRGTLVEALPRYEILSCAYVLIVIGKDAKTGRSAVGDIILAGQMKGKMSSAEINAFRNKSYVAKHLNTKLDEMLLTIKQNDRGALRIVNQY